MLYTYGTSPLLKVKEAERQRLREWSRSADAGWVERERVQMVLLAGEGRSAPHIARHLLWSTKTVRRVLRGWVQHGTDALSPQLAGRKSDVQRRAQVERNRPIADVTLGRTSAAT